MTTHLFLTEETQMAFREVFGRGSAGGDFEWKSWSSHRLEFAHTSESPVHVLVYVADTGLSLSNASTFEFGLGIKQGTTPPSRQTIMDSNEPPYYSTYKWPLHTILHTNFIMLQIMLIMLNYAVYANLCLRDALNYAKCAQLC